ncbi:MAG: tetratricopeptide repeat protein, partial [Caldilineaceae bacterium]|nr:tetratricopeptide repeat protein [Caldilineaceae bacterium]
GLSHQSQGEYAEAVKHLTESRDLYEKLERPGNVADLWNQLGDTYRLWGKQEEALAHYAEALKRYEALERWASVADVQLGIGLSYSAHESYVEAESHLKAGIKEAEGLFLNEEAAKIWIELSELYLSQQDAGSALVGIDHALKISDALDLGILRGKALTCQGYALTMNLLLSEAIACFEQSIAHLQYGDEPKWLAKAELGLVRVSWLQGNRQDVHDDIAHILATLDERYLYRDKAFLCKEIVEFFVLHDYKDDAKRYLLQAEALFSSLGIQAELDRLNNVFGISVE